MNEIRQLKDYSLDELTRILKDNSEEDSSMKGLTDIKSGLDSFDRESVFNMVIEKQRVIYGTDNRLDFYDIDQNDPKNINKVKNMNATVALIESNKIRDLGNGKSEILVKKFSDAFGLCPSEKFIEQPIAAFCSGFLINSNSIATAGHCVIPSRNGGIKLEDIRLVFGFRMNDVGDPNVIINNSEIYKVGEIIGKDFTKDGPDWALIKLDRHVENHEPVQIRKEGKIEDKTELYSIGHPCGLPQKIGTGGAYVRNNSNDDFFVANLDTYHGNSGSPVIENDTHTVEGILVRGETDFQTVNGCKKSLVCPTTGCRGEDCFRINKIVNLIE